MGQWLAQSKVKSWMLTKGIMISTSESRSVDFSRVVKSVSGKMTFGKDMEELRVSQRSTGRVS